MESSSPQPGILYKQNLTIRGNEMDNFYLLRLHKLDFEKMSVKDVNYVFTEREINDAMTRFTKEHPEGLRLHGKLGTVTDISYNNHCGTYVTRYICRFFGGSYISSPNNNIRAMFTPREIRRAEERYAIYIKGGLRKFFVKLVSKARAFKNRWFCE